jgi:transcriptional regulator with XRE-family HTH domain
VRHFDPFPLGRFQIDWQAFGEMVYQIRVENGFTMREFAVLTGISPSTLCRCEQGHSLETDHFFTLLQVLGLPFEVPEQILKHAPLIV